MNVLLSSSSEPSTRARAEVSGQSHGYKRLKERGISENSNSNHVKSHRVGSSRDKSSQHSKLVDIWTIKCQ